MAQLPLIRQNQAANAHIDGATPSYPPTSINQRNQNMHIHQSYPKVASSMSQKGQLWCLSWWFCLPLIRQNQAGNAHIDGATPSYLPTSINQPNQNMPHRSELSQDRRQNQQERHQSCPRTGGKTTRKDIKVALFGTSMAQLPSFCQQRSRRFKTTF